ncbi:MAG: A/G-specific adenine glycosylase [Fimbriimonadaceae bacterium]
MIEAIQSWYLANARPLPWREIPPDPYRVLVSEFMCQQTQIQTVLPYFDRWMASFPSVNSVAEADVSELMSLWQGLGYYRRVRNLKQVCDRVAQNGWPRQYDDWLSQPGIGKYTAAALASILDGQRVAVVDGNVARFFARHAASDAIGSQLLSKAQTWANGLIKEAECPGAFNQALMEIGARVCTPRRPCCDVCPVQSSCHSFGQGLQEEYPRKKPTAKPIPIIMPTRVCIRNGRVALSLPTNGWWDGLWCLPPETEETERPPEKVLIHTVTNHRVELRLYRKDEMPQHSTWFDLTDLPPMPAPHRRGLRQLA